MKDVLSAPIPLSVVVFLIAQTMGFVWWGSNELNGISSRISSLEASIVQLNKLDEGRSSHEGRIIVLEQVAVRVRDDLAEIKNILRNRYGTQDGSNP